jgi:uncharacterized membrane protein
MSDGTGRRSFSLVGAKGTFFQFGDKLAPTFLATGFFMMIFFFVDILLLLVVAIFSPLQRNSA